MSEIRSQATPARDELVHILAGAVLDNPGGIGTLPQHAANRIIANGWSKPRTVNSIEELHALPVETVIRCQDGWVGEISIVSGKPVIFWIGNECEDDLEDITLPVTVLFTPGEAG